MQPRQMQPRQMLSNHPYYKKIEFLGYDYYFQELSTEMSAVYQQAIASSINQPIVDWQDPRVIFNSINHLIINGDLRGEDVARPAFRKVLNMLLFDTNRGKLLNYGDVIIDHDGQAKVVSLRYEEHGIFNRRPSAPETTDDTCSAETVTVEQEVFEAGMLLYYMVSGHIPFANAVEPDWWYKRIISGKADVFWMSQEMNRQDPFSNEFKDLFVRMVERDPQRRITLREIEAHPWMDLMSYDPRSVINQVIDGSLRGEEAARPVFRKVLDMLKRSDGFRLISHSDVIIDYDGVVKMISHWSNRLPMAPETTSATRSAETITAEQEVFEAGMLLYNMVSGHIPFANAIEPDWLYKRIVSGKADVFWRSQEMNRRDPFSDEFKDLFMRMVERDPQRRITLHEIEEHPWMSGSSVV